MEDLIDLIATDSSAAEVSDQIKNVLYAKASERVDALRPYVADSMFGEEGEESVSDEGEE